ncbi:MAG: HK97 gp10 family phage protein [Candidatus Aminicenantes bacterium]|nr:HK97 gp10 family phage protein [Candidatus Aminicenantes bacterium]
MSDYLTFEIKGLKEMGDQLAQLPGKIARRALANAVRQGANIIRDAARAKAPVGTKTYKDYRGKTHRPGLLRKSGVISKKLKTKDWQSTALYGVGFSKRAFYGKWIERGKAKKHRQAPAPFVVPTLDEKAPDVIEAIKERLGSELEKIVRETPGLSLK